MAFLTSCSAKFLDRCRSRSQTEDIGQETLPARERGRPALPVLKQVPVPYRFKVPQQTVGKDQTPVPEPTDAEFPRVNEMEFRIIDLSSMQKRHKIVVVTEKHLSGARPNQNQILGPHGSGSYLDIRVRAGVGASSSLLPECQLIVSLVRVLTTMT